MNRELLETRSPAIYRQWYIATPTPRCPICGRTVDGYRPTDADRTAVVVHNLHAQHALGLDIQAQPLADRTRWMDTQRRDAFAEHLKLSGKNMYADRTLRSLCELDDPMRRKTLESGAWMP